MTDELILEIRDVTDLGLLRATIRDVIGSALPRTPADDLVLAINEVVTVPLRRGSRPVDVRLWTTPDHVMCMVACPGDLISELSGGAAIPSAGRLSTAPEHRRSTDPGLELWIAGHLCETMNSFLTSAGTVVELVAARLECEQRVGRSRPSRQTDPSALAETDLAEYADRIVRRVYGASYSLASMSSAVGEPARSQLLSAMSDLDAAAREVRRASADLTQKADPKRFGGRGAVPPQPRRANGHTGDNGWGGSRPPRRPGAIGR